MGIFDAFTGAPARNAAAQNTALYNANKTEGMGYLDTGYGRGVGALNNKASVGWNGSSFSIYNTTTG